MPSDFPQPENRESFASPELEMLADQLRQDAQWLAARYPACKPRLPLRKSHRLRWVAVACVAGLLLLSIDAWRTWTSPPQSAPMLAESQRSIPAATAAPSAAPAAIPALVQPRPSAALFHEFHDLNGAEKEAVIDLLEDRELPNPSLPL